jgi:DNA-binding XRE family transcriptional regulator
MVTQGSRVATFRPVRTLHGTNVRRLMAQQGLTQADVVAATGLDERTVRSLMRGAAQPHARTLHKFAAGLGIEVDELFRDPADASWGSDAWANGAAAFDRATNPAVAAAIERHPAVFARWTAGEFEELASRVGVGGELTETGALAAAEAMNDRRVLLERVAVLLESSEGELLQEFVAMLYRRATDV